VSLSKKLAGALKMNEVTFQYSLLDSKKNSDVNEFSDEDTEQSLMRLVIEIFPAGFNLLCHARNQ
jgi:hypothetical protein